MITTPKSIQWQKNRSAFNHNWLKNSFLTGELEQWLAFVDDRIEGGSFTLDDFNSTIVSQWKNRSSDLLVLVKGYTESMSPDYLFETSALNRLSAKTSSWLRPLSIFLWKERFQCDLLIASVLESYRKANEAFYNLNLLAHLLQDEHTVKSSDFPVQLKIFIERCRELSEEIHKFQTSIKII